MRERLLEESLWEQKINELQQQRKAEVGFSTTLLTEVVEKVWKPFFYYK